MHCASSGYKTPLYSLPECFSWRIYRLLGHEDDDWHSQRRIYLSAKRDLLTNKTILFQFPKSRRRQFVVVVVRWHLVYTYFRWWIRMQIECLCVVASELGATISKYEIK